MKQFLSQVVLEGLFCMGLFCMLPLTVNAEDVSNIRVGWIGPLTGSSAALGVDSVSAIQMAFDEINGKGGVNGHKLELVVEDDQYITAKTLSAYSKLVDQQKIRVFFIITYGGLFAIANRAERDGVLLLDPLDCDDAIAKLPSNSICIAKKTEDLGFVIAESAAKNGDIPAGIIYFEGDPFMGTAAKASRAKLEQLKHPFAYAEGYVGGTTDFKSMLLQAKSKGVKSLFFFGYDEMGLAMRQARELGIQVPFYSMNTLPSPGYKEAAGKAAEGAYVVNWLAPRGAKFDKFMTEFKKRIGREPFLEISTIPSFDIAQMLGVFLTEPAALSPTGINVTEVKKKFYAVTDYQGLSGPISIDSDGIARTLKNRMYKFEAGALKLVAP